MTRINLVDPSTLHQKHLIAEYRELPRVFTLAQDAWYRGEQQYRGPVNYVLGTGHVLFFYNKLLWLQNRFNLLVAECDKRGFNIQHRNAPATYKPDPWWKDWTPRPEDVALSQARILERMPK